MQAATPQSPASARAPALEPHRALLNQYCAGCHNERLKTAGLLLDKADLARVPENAELWEKVVRRLRAGTMPPQGLPRPDNARVDAFATWLETSIDQAAKANPNPGRALPHRLNRAEYANAVRDLLALDVDPAQLLPSDDESYGFDNIADVLKLSPVLLERYLSAAWNLSRLAVGDPGIQPATATYRVRPDLSQNDHVDGLPLGTQGGIMVRHNFPLDGEYIIKVRLWRTTQDQPRGLEEPHKLEVTLDSARVFLASIGGKEDYDAVVKKFEWQKFDDRLTVRIPVHAGPRQVGVAFLQQSEAENDLALQPFLRSTIDPVDYSGLPHIDRVTISGPFNSTGSGDTPSRRQVFTCRPASASDELPCAKQIVSALARRAFRRQLTANDMETLLGYYQKGRNKGTFDTGIEMAIRAILADPEFVTRFESTPPNAAANVAYRVSDPDLASRLSFFLWSSVPDDELLNLAAQGKLNDPAILQQQVRRMLADPRFGSAGQELRQPVALSAQSSEHHARSAGVPRFRR